MIMENSSLTFDLLPVEMKMQIIRCMNTDTRNSFENVSDNCKRLVDATNVRCLEHIRMVYSYGWKIFVRTKKEIHRISNASFDKAKEFMQNHLKNIDCVKEILLHVKDLPQTLELGQVKVDKLVFKPYGTNYEINFALYQYIHNDEIRQVFIMKNICYDHQNQPKTIRSEIAMLRQFDAEYLSEFQMHHDKYYYRTCRCQVIYNIPQITLPDKLVMNHSSMRNDQLYRLNASYLKIDNVYCINEHGFANYVKNCLAKLNTKNINFHIGFKLVRKHSVLRRFPKSKLEKITQVQHGSYVSIFNSPDPEYQFGVIQYHSRKFNNLQGMRIPSHTMFHDAQLLT